MGLDMSPAAIVRAQEKATNYPRTKGLGEPSYQVADIHTWNAPEAYDLVICVDAVVCFRDQHLAVKNIVDSLCPGGRLVMTTLNPLIYERIKRNSQRPLQEGPVSNWLSKEELHSIVEAAGLSIERSETIMPSGNMGPLRIINSPRLNRAFGPTVQAWLKRLKERAGIGQYRLLVARKAHGVTK
jgi:SAM-dependent methyltransferase